MGGVPTVHIRHGRRCPHPRRRDPRPCRTSATHRRSALIAVRLSDRDSRGGDSWPPSTRCTFTTEEVAHAPDHRRLHRHRLLVSAGVADAGPLARLCDGTSTARNTGRHEPAALTPVQDRQARAPRIPEIQSPVRGLSVCAQARGLDVPPAPPRASTRAWRASRGRATSRLTPTSTDRHGRCAQSRSHCNRARRHPPFGPATAGRSAGTTTRTIRFAQLRFGALRPFEFFSVALGCAQNSPRVCPVAPCRRV